MPGWFDLSGDMWVGVGWLVGWRVDRWADVRVDALVGLVVGKFGGWLLGGWSFAVGWLAIGLIAVEKRFTCVPGHASLRGVLLLLVVVQDGTALFCIILCIATQFGCQNLPGRK